jgi:hypothetical protein
VKIKTVKTAHIGQLINVVYLVFLPFWKLMSNSVLSPIHPAASLHLLLPPAVFMYIFVLTHKHMCLTTSCITIISHQDAKLSQYIWMLTPAMEAEGTTSIKQYFIYKIGAGDSEG